MDKFLSTYNQSKLNHEDIKHLDRSITNNEIETVTEPPYKEEART
jgi:hypothetical protein